MPSKRPTPSRSSLLTGLSSTVFKLGWVSLFADISSEMLYPVVPIFLTTVLGAPVAALGFIEGSAEAVASLLKPSIGYWSDRLQRRRPFVFGGYVLSALARPLIALASAWPLVMVSRGLDRIGKGLRTSPRDALLADSVAPAFRGKAFGWHRGMDTLGAILGPLAALGLIRVFHDDLRWIFVVAFVPALIGAFLVLTVKEVRPAASKAPAKTPFRWPQLPAAFKRYLWAWGLFSVANSSDMFLLLKVKVSGFTTVGTILVYGFYNIVYAAASPWLGGLSDRVGRKGILVGGLLVFALVYGGFALATQAWQYWALFGAYGFYIAATDGVGKAYAVDLAPVRGRAASLGLLGTVMGLGALLASSVAGLLWTWVGPWACFAYGAGGALLGALLIGINRAPGPAPG